MMDSKELEDYVKKQLAKGFPLKEIGNKLLESGYSKDSVSGVISEFKEKGIATEKYKLSKKTIIMILSLIVLLTSISVFYLMRMQEQIEVQEPPDVQEEIVEEEDRGVVRLWFCYALSSGNLSICEVFKEANEPENFIYCKNGVHTIAAYKNKDPSQCDMLDGSVRKVYDFSLPGHESADDVGTCKAIVGFISEGRVDELCEIGWGLQKDINPEYKNDFLLSCKGVFNVDASFCAGISNEDFKNRCNTYAGDCKALPAGREWI